MGDKIDNGLTEMPGRMPPGPSAVAFASTLALILLCALAMLAVQRLLPSHLLPPEVLPLVFLSAVLLAAVAFGFWCGLLAAGLAFAVLNFLFTPPLYTFHVASLTDLVWLVEFLMVAALCGLLAGRLHDRAEAARLRAETLEVLSDLSAALVKAQSPAEALAAALAPLGRLSGGQAICLTLEAPLANLSPATQAAAERALRTGLEQPAAAPGWEGSTLTFLPLAEGVLLGHAPIFGPEAPRRLRAIAALAQQTRLALQRLDFAAQIGRAHV